MVDRVASLEKLVHELSQLPGIGPKTAQRLAYFILRSSKEYAHDLQEAIHDVKTKVKECPQCYSYTEDELCHYCSDLHRQNDLICVVEDPSDISRLESSQVFRGRYHVLHGAISPLDGITPQDLKIQALINRIEESRSTPTPITEVILALDADLEGDTTVLYLAKILGQINIKVTRIAHGVPIGGDIDYIDHRTLGRALENRIEL
ncbi:MAG: recombination protein RecR [Bdellovibrionales bacterium]|nr:recombination protein RecR [Bdellovibrionales bacterium]